VRFTGPLQPRKILVVDSEPEFRATVATHLASHGFEVLQATDGIEMWLHLKRARPHVIVFDPHMPRLGGLDAVKRVRAFAPTIRVVVVTRDLDAETRQRALALGADTVLPKPLATQELLAALMDQEWGRGSGETPTGRAGIPGPAPVAHVLVVDDDPHVRVMFEEFLAVEGYHVRSAPDARAALDNIIETPPDVVLLDITMPGLSGIDALEAIRAVAPGTTVIMVSGIGDVETAKRALAHGAFDYIAKPVDLAYLAQSVETAWLMKQIDPP
jgi:DNA-binding response OmpR family regulator